MNKTFVGNQFAYESIRCHMEQKDPGPLILYGSSGLGKILAAKTAASFLLDIPEDKLTLYPDFYLLDKKDEVIKVEDIQLLLERSSISPVGGKKVFIIHNAENMNIQAQNKLLILLEDRNETNKLIFTCNQNLLLDTIISRCNVVTFFPLPIKEMEEYLKRQGVEPEGRYLAAYLCDACPYKWEEVQFCFDALNQTYKELIRMEQKKDIFRVLNLLIEKDPKSFYEVHSKHLLTALQLFQYVFYHLILLKLGGDVPEQIQKEFEILKNIYSINQAYDASVTIEKHKGQALKYTKNDFFDLMRVLS